MLTTDTKGGPMLSRELESTKFNRVQIMHVSRMVVGCKLGAVDNVMNELLCMVKLRSYQDEQSRHNMVASCSIKLCLLNSVCLHRHLCINKSIISKASSSLFY